jgi:hypothetical protein
MSLTGNEVPPVVMKAFVRSIEGSSLLQTRKKLSCGEEIRIKYGDDEYTISVEDGKALLKIGDGIVHERPFIAWGEIDDRYESMFTSFSDDLEINNDKFLTASDEYRSRFSDTPIEI